MRGGVISVAFVASRRSCVHVQVRSRAPLSKSSVTVGRGVVGRREGAPRDGGFTSSRVGPFTRRVNDRPHQLCLATWNLQSCSRGIDRIAAELRALAADVIVLQEVDRGTERARGMDQVAELARRAGYAHHAFFPALPWDRGEYGLGLISRHRVMAHRTEKLPTQRGTEQRVLGSAMLETGAGPLTVHVTHLSHRRSERALRLRQVDAIRARCARDETPAVLAGDFNDMPGTSVHRALTETFIDAFDAVGVGHAGTYPLAFGRAIRIDYAFATRGVRPVRAEVVRSRASDHFAVTATFARSA